MRFQVICFAACSQQETELALGWSLAGVLLEEVENTPSMPCDLIVSINDDNAH